LIEQKPGVLDELAAERTKQLESEIAELEKQAEQRNQKTDESDAEQELTFVNQNHEFVCGRGIIAFAAPRSKTSRSTTIERQLLFNLSQVFRRSARRDFFAMPKGRLRWETGAGGCRESGMAKREAGKSKTV
jgi:hypothetical protein